MARPSKPIREENLFLTGATTAPATALSEKLGLNPMEMTESEECTEDEVTREFGSDSETSEDDGEVEDFVQEEMDRLEAIFDERGLKYRMINRIGEGSLLG